MQQQAKGKSGKAPPSSQPAKNNGNKGKDAKTSRTASNPQGASDNDWETRRHDIRELLNSNLFDMAIGIVICLNAVTIGIEQTQTLNGQDTLGVRIIESFFLVIYIGELAMRFFGHGLSFIRDRWVKFDVMLVLLGILNSWILEPAGDEAPEEMGVLMLLRTARLMRLAKTARLLAKVHEFWMLVRGLMNCLSMIAYIFVILCVVMYCFTSLAIELITKHRLVERDEAFRLHVETYFSSLPQTMLTLMQFVTLDDVSSVYKPLCEKDPWLTIYFVAVILLVSVLSVNLVAAVIISSTLDANQKELDVKNYQRERDWGDLIASLKHMFSNLDYSKPGQLTLEELLTVDEKDLHQLCNALHVSTPADLFKQLDTDKAGEVPVSEFFDRVLDRVLAKGNANLKRMERQIETMHWRIKERFVAQSEMSENVKKLTNKLEDVWTATCGDPLMMNARSSSKTPPNGQRRDSNGSAIKLNQYAVSNNNICINNNGSSISAVKAAVLSSDPELASWEEDMSQKVRSMVDDGLQFAFERLRKVAETAKAEGGRVSKEPPPTSTTKRPAPPKPGPKRSSSPSPPGSKVVSDMAQQEPPKIAVSQAHSVAVPSQSAEPAAAVEPSSSSDPITSAVAAPGISTTPSPRASSQQL